MPFGYSKLQFRGFVHGDNTGSNPVEGANHLQALSAHFQNLSLAWRLFAGEISSRLAGLNATSMSLDRIVHMTSPLWWHAAKIQPWPLSYGHVHVWAWTWDESHDAPTDVLASEEFERMQRFRFRGDQVRYAVCHDRMRRLLGAYAGKQPATLRFAVNSYGKPRLHADDGGDRLRFNLSHTRQSAVLAISWGLELGVDIEEHKPLQPGEVEVFFSARERAALRELQGDVWLAAFYRCWTRKEAVLKAEGCGLTLDLSSFSVNLDSEPAVPLVHWEEHADRRTVWHLHSLTPGPGLSGCVATSEVPGSVQHFLLEEAWILAQSEAKASPSSRV